MENEFVMANKKNRPCIDCGELTWDVSLKISSGRCKPCWAKFKLAGIPLSTAHKAKISGPRVENPGYHTKHNRVYSMWGKAKLCEECGVLNAKRYEWANLSGNYILERKDWKQLCTSCHNRLDNKILNIKHMREKML